MTIQNERSQSKRLEEQGLRILTTFWDNGLIRQRSTDRSAHDDVVNGVIMNKKYYRGERLLRTEKVFNPLLQYSFVIRDQMEKEISCPNCGTTGKTADFADGCPYCGTCYNIGYGERKNAGKRSAEKRSPEPAEYLSVLFGLLAVFIVAGLLLVRAGGRTFGLFDVLKGIVFGALGGLLAFCLYYTSRIYAITRRAEESYRVQLDRIRGFETRLAAFGIPVNVFYTNLSSELNHLFFDGGDPRYADVVDWDVLDYGEYGVSGENENDLAVSVTAELRIIRGSANRLRAEKARLHAVMKPNAVSGDPLRPGANVIRCRNCGCSIDITRPACPQCGTPIRYRQRLYLTECREN